MVLMYQILFHALVCRQYRCFCFLSYVVLSSLFSTGLSRACWISSIRLKHSSLSCSAASIIPTLWARVIYDVRVGCVVVVGESVILSES